MRIILIIALTILSFTANAAPFQGACDGVTNDTPALNAQLHAQEYSRDHEIVFPAGNCIFNSEPDPINRSMSLIGQSKSLTVLVRNYSGNFLTIYGQGSRITNLTLFAAQGTSGGVGLYMVSSEAVGAGGNHVIEHIWITGYGTWGIPLLAYGTDKITPPLGIRDISMMDVVVFNGQYWAMECWDCIAFEWIGGGVYQGFGTTQAIAFGGGMSAGNYLNANIDYAASTFWPGVMRPK